MLHFHAWCNFDGYQIFHTDFILDRLQFKNYTLCYENQCASVVQFLSNMYIFVYVHFKFEAVESFIELIILVRRLTFFNIIKLAMGELSNHFQVAEIIFIVTWYQIPDTHYLILLFSISHHFLNAYTI